MSDKPKVTAAAEVPMSKMFEYISGQADGKIAELEAREEYALGHLEVQLTENETLRAEIERLKELCEVRAEIMEAQEKEIAATIERCAQVAESTTYMSGAHIAAAIRALKDKT